jgi:Tfp pilus assembly protein PilF
MDLSAWMLLGNAYAGLGVPGEAEECFTTCTRIRPQYPFSYFQRGLARFEQRKYQAAADDFGSYMRRAGPSAAALINRALARHKDGNHEGALTDLDAALAAGGKQTRIYFIRADVRRALGDLSGAEADRELGLSLTPTDATSFLARGIARLADEPQLALADFRQALLLDPGSRAAKQNMVHLLADRFNKPAEALTILDSLLAANPQDARALASRAVLKARQGDRSAAQRDALQALSIDDDPTIILQAACAFAASARKYPPDEATAFRLLAKALGAKPALAEAAAADPDLEALRSSSNFDRILEAADIMRRGGEGPEAESSND